MSKHTHHRDIRHQIATQAAQLMAEAGDLTYAQARDKAAKRLNCSDRRQFPEHREIEAALKAHLQLFQPVGQHSNLLALRKTALKAMQTLNQFQPQLVGAVLSGTANQHTPISLVLFSDTVEAVVIDMMERHIPFRQREIRVDYAKQKGVQRTRLTFIAGDEQIELLILPLSDRHNLPLDPIQGRPQKGASISKVTALLEAA
ncbi:MAG: hypothetical protein OQL20_04515 [Sedimenticola sp.]|nr:hypothetical protein [Sedimenticola sp.]